MFFKGVQENLFIFKFRIFELKQYNSMCFMLYDIEILYLYLFNKFKVYNMKCVVDRFVL